MRNFQLRTYALKNNQFPLNKNDLSIELSDICNRKGICRVFEFRMVEIPCQKVAIGQMLQLCNTVAHENLLKTT